MVKCAAVVAERGRRGGELLILHQKKEVGVKSVNILAESTTQTLVLLIVADLKIGIYFARLLGDVQWSFFIFSHW